MRTVYGLLTVLQLCFGWTSEDKSNGESGTEDRWNGLRSQVQGIGREFKIFKILYFFQFFIF
jgi:hypothetical protein